LINLICDRSLLAGYSTRTHRITPDMVSQAACSLELPSPNAPRQRLAAIEALTRRAPLYAAAAVVLLSCGFALSSAAYFHQRFTLSAQAASDRQRERTSQPTLAVTNVAASVAPPAAVSRQLPADAALTIVVGSYPIGDARTVADVAALTDWLETSGFRVYYAEVDLGGNGRWQRVLAGAYTDPQIAQRDEERLKAAAPHSDVHVVSAGVATGTIAAAVRRLDAGERPSGS
jgi:hypothetical protein